MKVKNHGIVLVLVMLLTAVPTFAADAQETVQNGSMETIGTDGAPVAWTMVRAEIGKN